jgi:hypothetical protein
MYFDIDSQPSLSAIPTRLRGRQVNTVEITVLEVKNNRSRQVVFWKEALRAYAAI